MCDQHPFGSSSGATCSRPDPHDVGHVYVSTWAPDGLHDDETGDW